MFQHNSNARIILNGHQSQPFSLARGCRQGDPISPYLFIPCTEFLTLAFKNEINCEGITISQKEHKLCQYANDTLAFMKANERNLKIALMILQWFYVQTELTINVSKTKVIRIGTIRESDRRYCKENNPDWVNTFMCLGIKYKILEMENITTYNTSEKLPLIECLIQNWQNRNLTPLGRVTVWNSLILSKITHILMSLPSPQTELVKKLDDLCIEFIWNNRRHGINKKLLNKREKDWGMNLMNVSPFDLSLKTTWIRKLINTDPDWSEFAECYNVHRLCQTDELYHKKLRHKALSKSH